jgi:hypothetical protein
MRAQKLRAEEMQAFAEAIGAHTGNRCGEVVARALAAAFR